MFTSEVSHKGGGGVKGNRAGANGVDDPRHYADRFGWTLAEIRRALAGGKGGRQWASV